MEDDNAPDIQLRAVQNTTFVDNVVYGEPAGDRAVAISPNRTEIVASPRMRVWLWPDGPFVMTDPNVGIAESIITVTARPILQSIQDVRPCLPYPLLQSPCHAFAYDRAAS